MQVMLHVQGVSLPPKSRSVLAHRISHALARFAQGIARLHVSLKDVNGPRGGRDKVCMLRADLVSGRQIVVVDRSARMRRAISRCLRRARFAMTCESQKRRLRGRRRT